MKNILEKYLAKSDGETLYEHTKSILLNAEYFINLYGDFLRFYSNEECDLTRIIIYSCLLHDLGKIHKDFQKVLVCDSEKFQYRHEILSLAFVDLFDIGEQEKKYLIGAIAFHHKTWDWIKGGNISSKNPPYYIDELNYDEINAIQRLCSGLDTTEYKELTDYLIEDSYSFLKSVISIDFRKYETKQIPDFKPDKIIYDNLKLFDVFYEGTIKKSFSIISFFINGIIMLSDHQASSHCKIPAINKLKNDLLLEKLNWKRDNLRPHQEQLYNHKGNVLLIAPTGSGKTESSLFWALNQKEVGNTNGRIFFILPYRASMNAMSNRLSTLFGRENISLIHGKSLLKAYELFLENNYTKKDAERLAKIQNNIDRFNFSDIRISSPFQIFKPFFGQKGYELLLTFFINGNFIIDEIHAYDHKITSFTLASLKFLKEYFKINVMFMSATMPSHLISILKNNFEIQGTIKPPENWLLDNKRHILNVIDDTIFSVSVIDAISELSINKSILIVVNQVDRAIKLYNQLKEKSNIVLLHSRFNSEDREKKEKNIAPEKGKILIATQVVEVSLDIDYDTCFTELAPFEALLQRFGRVNRNKKKDLCNVFVCSKFEDENGHLPYDKDHLHQVFNVLMTMDKKEILETELQFNLDNSYTEYMKNKIRDEIDIQIKNFGKYFIEKTLPYGINSDTLKDISDQWDDLFEGKEIIPKVCLDKITEINNPFEIKKYLVPVSEHKFYKYKKDKIVFNEDLKEFVADLEYSEEYGLIF